MSVSTVSHHAKDVSVPRVSHVLVAAADGVRFVDQASVDGSETSTWEVFQAEAADGPQLRVLACPRGVSRKRHLIYFLTCAVRHRSAGLTLTVLLLVQHALWREDDRPAQDRCQRCQPGKYLLDVVQWPASIGASEAEWPPQAPLHLVRWNARDVLFGIRDCGRGLGVECPLDISYNIYQDYPEEGYKWCTPASATASNTCGRIVAMGIGNTADLPAGKDYLLVASHAGFYTGYFTIPVEAGGDNDFTLEMVEELSAREERVVLHWESSDDLDLYVVNADDSNNKVYWGRDEASIIGGSGRLEVDNEFGWEGPETTILQDLTSGTGEVWINSYSSTFSYDKVAQYPVTVDIFCHKCLNDLGQDTAGYVTSVTQQAEDVQAPTKWWKVGQFVASDGLLVDGHPAVQWQTCTADCYPDNYYRRAYADDGVHLQSRGKRAHDEAHLDIDDRYGYYDEDLYAYGKKTQLARPGRTLQHLKADDDVRLHSRIGRDMPGGSDARRLLSHQNTGAPVHGLNEQCLTCPAGGTCSGGFQVQFAESHNWDTRDGMYVLVDCPTGHKVINTTGGTAAFSHDSQKCQICDKGEECTESICTACEPCRAGLGAETFGASACEHCITLQVRTRSKECPRAQAPP